MKNEVEYLDIFFPETDYEELMKVSIFNIIYPYGHQIPKLVTPTTAIRLICLEDEDFLTVIEEDFPNKKEFVEQHTLAQAYYDINYIRHCAVRNIVKNEWFRNWGPSSLKDWVKCMKEVNTDKLVTVVAFQKPNLSLPLFNKRYEAELKKGR